jgi:hypothetical protein
VHPRFLVAFMSDDLGQPPLGKHGGPRKRGERNPETMPTGVRRDYILRRLERDGRHDLAQAIREDRVSAYSIAVELGWTKRAEPIGTGSINASKQRQYRLRTLMNGGALPRTGAGDIDSCGLTYSELQELWLGPCNGSVFDTTEQLRAAWDRGRDVVMRLWATNGKRPMAWWCFEAPGLGLTWPGYDHQQSYLYEHNVLSETEREQLLARWRKEFEQACSLKDTAARKAHLDWAGVPASLRRQWQAERRRHRRQSAPLQEEAAAT